MGCGEEKLFLKSFLSRILFNLDKSMEKEYNIYTKKTV